MKFQFKGKEVKYKNHLIWTGRDNGGHGYAASISDLEGVELFYTICSEKDPIIRVIEDFLFHSQFEWRKGLKNGTEYAIVGDCHLYVYKEGKKWVGTIFYPNFGCKTDPSSSMKKVKLELERKARCANSL